MMAPTCKRLTWVGFLAAWSLAKCPAWLTKTLRLGKLVYQNMLLCVVHASGGTVGADSLEIWCELRRTTLDGVTWNGSERSMASSTVFTRTHTPQLSCPVNWHFWRLAEQHSPSSQRAVLQNMYAVRDERKLAQISQQKENGCWTDEIWKK